MCNAKIAYWNIWSLFMVYLQLHQQTKPTVHVDAFLYDDEIIDSLCEEGKMSRNYCLTCGSHQTAPLGKHVMHSGVCVCTVDPEGLLYIMGNKIKLEFPLCQIQYVPVLGYTQAGIVIPRPKWRLNWNTLWKLPPVIGYLNMMGNK